MIQLVKYKCCGKVFAACAEPYCYTDVDWIRELRKYVKAGHVVQMINNGESFNFERCTCNNKDQKSNEPDLFSQP